MIFESSWSVGIALVSARTPFIKCSNTCKAPANQTQYKLRSNLHFCSFFSQHKSGLSFNARFNLNKFKHKYSYCERLMHLKRHIKRNLCTAFKKKIVWIVFSIQELLRPKIVLLNLDIYQFSYSERLINAKRHLHRF